MEDRIYNSRTAEVSVESVFIDRWSPRSFDPTPLTYHELVKLFEAARWSPSCRNEQPWLFVYATSAADRKRFASILDDKNRRWASQAPVLLYILTSKSFLATQQPNCHAQFDTGAAWMALAMQAQRQGLYTHCMAGFDRQKAYRVLAAREEEYDIVAAVAIGRRGCSRNLPDDLADKECPSNRKALDQIVVEGNLKKQTALTRESHDITHDK